MILDEKINMNIKTVEKKKSHEGTKQKSSTIKLYSVLSKFTYQKIIIEIFWLKQC